MRAFITTIRDLFKLDTNKDDAAVNFCQEKKALCIPKFQREYKWETEKIETLITDVRNQQKFFGCIMLKEAKNCYEISDGQQRITTWYLILVYLYNCYKGQTREQEAIQKILKPYGKFILENDTIGQYLHENAGNIELSIDREKDIYYQNESFERAYKTIENRLGELTTHEQRREFKEKLLNSQALVLITEETPGTSTEQIYLDINEKAQLLDVEDIFKGHCFEIFEPEAYKELRETWVKVKKCSVGFQVFGVKDLSEYLYLFLLEHDSTDLPEKLNPKGRHYLEGKTMDETQRLLEEMIEFGHSVIGLSQKLTNMTYRFEDLCSDVNRYKNTDYHIALKAMCTEILTNPKAVYQKLPFMYLIYILKNDKALQQELSYEQFRIIVTNLYVYAVLFSMSTRRKSKKMIDQTVRDAARKSADRVKGIIEASKKLRAEKVKAYKAGETAKFENLALLYSIMDNYKAAETWLPQIYSRDDGYNLEHFVIPDTTKAEINWKTEDGTKSILVDKTFAGKNKKSPCNFLIINSELNRQVGRDDIVRKIDAIKEWHSREELTLPKHIAIIIDYIENMKEYCELQACKTNPVTDDIVKEKYKKFLEAYFEEDSQAKLLTKLEEGFRESFRNDQERK